MFDHIVELRGLEVACLRSWRSEKEAWSRDVFSFWPQVSCIPTNVSVTRSVWGQDRQRRWKQQRRTERCNGAGVGSSGAAM